MSKRNNHAARTAPHPMPVHGITLRSILVTLLLDQPGPCTVDELASALRRRGLATPGRVSKDISDALRWEIGRGRVRRVARGTYVASTVPKTTIGRMRGRAAAAAASGRT